MKILVLFATSFIIFMFLIKKYKAFNFSKNCANKFQIIVLNYNDLWVFGFHFDFVDCNEIVFIHINLFIVYF